MLGTDLGSRYRQRSVLISSNAKKKAFGTVDHDLHRSRLHSTTSIANAERLIHEQIERLSNIFQRSFEEGEVLELRMRFFAFTTDTVALFSLGQSMDLLDNDRRAEEWNRTVCTVTKVTPFVKQFPWIINVDKKLPISVVR